MSNIVRILLLLTLIAIQPQTLADLFDNPIVPKKDATLAKEYLQKLRDRDFEYVKSLIHPDLSNKLNDQLLEKMVNLFPSGKLLTTELIGSQVHTFDSTWQGNFTFEYQFEGGWALANTAFKRVDNKLYVVGLNVYRTQASQKEINKFTLTDKSPFHFIVLTSAIAVPIIILVTLVFCIKTPIPKRKWLWVLFILGSIGSVSINWTTGAYGINILHYQLFGAGAVAASEYAPWIITAGFPLGALLFLLKRKKYVELAKANNSFNSDGAKVAPPS